MTTGYRRVSRKSPCRICGKPDWCSTTVDQDISFCARATTNADRLSRDGWGIYYNNVKKPFVSRYAFPAKQQLYLKNTLIAPIERRNDIYRKLIQLSPLPKGNGLNRRDEWRMSEQDREAGKFGIYPRTAIGRNQLVQTLIESIVKNESIIHSFKGVPGFWRGSNGRPRLGSDFDFVDDLLLIPFLNSKGQIQACQIKYLRDSPSRSGKYFWLSSIRQRDGCGPGTPLHHEGVFGFKGRSFGTVLVTEGALKAATVQSFLPDRYVVGNSGVATSHEEIVKTARNKDLEVAFDADCFTNPHVARAMASLLALRIQEQRFLSCDKPTKILMWDKRFKGIDDALIAGVSLKYLDVSEWLTLLAPDCFEVARHQLAGISL